jgi:hypothetical protein
LRLNVSANGGELTACAGRCAGAFVGMSATHAFALGALAPDRVTITRFMLAPNMDSLVHNIKKL